MIDYICDILARTKITTFPYTLRGPIAIISNYGRYIRCPAWGMGKTIVKFNEKYIYVESDTKGKIDIFNAHGDKVTTINNEELK